MARKPRIEFPGALYHVIVRGNNKQKTFVDDRDYEQFLVKLKKYKEQFEFILYAYALMPNHVHLLIETNEVPLSKIMQPLQFSYTQFFNRRHERVGHLFQGRYKAILCQKDTYLLELIRYITLNPLRASLVKSLHEWRWNSFYDIFQKVGEHIVSYEDVLALFARQPAKAMHVFRKFISDGLSEGHKEAYYVVKDQRVLGDDDYAEEVVKKIADDFEHYVISINEVMKLVSKHLGIDVGEILSFSRSRRGSRGRSVVGYICRLMGGFTIREIGHFFKRGEPTISKLIKRVECERMGSSDFRTLIEKIKNDIKKNFRPCLVRYAKGKGRAAGNNANMQA